MKIRKRLNIFLEWLVVILIAIMLFSVLWGVATRYIFADQSSWTDELARFMLIWVSMVGATYVAGKNEHIAIDLLPASMSEKKKIKMDIIAFVLIAVFVMAVFVIGGLRYVYISFHLGQTSAALGLPMGYVYSILPVCGVIIIYFKFLSIWEAKKLLKKPI
ncbi:TRAP transporter small permease [Autumnicola musiva]|uniref:TRAP transporter small permease n=1 Tax=Autumnicola musiva TaxID=3075589 RepID=A0ABU3D476_9FLAO|nr:TRAP transporter small permease [Zunongwangia sp. F117]MDT0676337.1 TRAP transporter small permease [Zunongwangia sp. F117]